MFTLRLAWRYAFSRSNRHRNATLVILGGIAVGMLAIVIMLSLMNSLQSDLLDQVKSIESFHMQVSFPNDHSRSEVVKQLQEIDDVFSVYPHVNTQVMVQNSSSDRSATARLRIIDTDIWRTDNPFSDRAPLLRGAAPGSGEIVVGASLAMRLGIGMDSPVTLTVLGSGRAVVLAPMSVQMENVGIFRTGLAEFDQSTIISDLDPLINLIGSKRIIYGLYLDPRRIDRSANVVRSIQEIFPEATVKTWQEVNSAFFSALTLEKVLMYLFLFFMFIILGVNMKNASARLLHVKQRELAILRATGSQRSLATRVFLGQTMIITLSGELIGIVLGMLVGRNISKIFSWINVVQYRFTGRSNMLLLYPFSTQIRISEILIIAVSVLLLALLFTYAGCRRELYREPMEMLYHD